MVGFKGGGSFQSLNYLVTSVRIMIGGEKSKEHSFLLNVHPDLMHFAVQPRIIKVFIL